MASSSRSTSVPPQSSSDTQSTCNTKKLPVHVNEEGLIVGPKYAKWGTRAGYFIRSCIPLHYQDWRDVPQVFKDNLWRCLMDEFTLNVPEEVARPWIEKGFPPKWRVIKSRFRSKNIRQCESLEVAKSNCPKGVDPNHWADFVTANANPKVKEKCATNAENRKKRTDYNTLGRQTFAQRIHIMDEKFPEKKHGRTDAWLDVHELSDGTILECSRQEYNVLQNKMTPSGNSQATDGVNRSPRDDIGSGSIPFPSHPNPQNMMNLSEQSNLRTRPTVNPKVNLLARDGAIVAKGFVETSETAGICHGKKVLHSERKVFVEEVFDRNAPIYDRPQDGNYILQDVTEGGYLIWLNEMLQYI